MPSHELSCEVLRGNNLQIGDLEQSAPASLLQREVEFLQRSSLHRAKKEAKVGGTITQLN